MIEIKYKIDLKKDGRSFEAFNIKNVTKGEAANFVLYLEKLRLDMVMREFELGEGGIEVSRDID